MIAAIEALFGIKVPAWVIEAVLILLLAGSAVLYLEHRGAQHELAKLQRSSAAVVAQAQRQVTRDAEDYQAAQAANAEKTHEADDRVAALQSRLADSVRQYDAYRRAHPNVPRPAGQPVAASAGECGAQRCSDIIVRLAERGNELARSVGELGASLQSCQRDRDALTGLPH